MSKPAKVEFVCGECGYTTIKWLGKCPSCGSWNTLVEQASKPVTNQGTARAVLLSSVAVNSTLRVSTGMEELDRVLGGGIVAGSAILLGGDPGIGKSTLLLQAASNIAQRGRVLYVTGEESTSQIKLRAERLDVDGDVYLLAETDLGQIEAEFDRLQPQYLIIDSIQTVYAPEVQSAPGSVSQIREATAILTRLAKSSGACVFIVGHVTKEGALAGPRVLEHMVDTVLYFEGERNDSFRILRAVKNRYGSTNEIGVFEMCDIGMKQVSDPSELFLTRTGAPGCAVTCAMEGTRPILVEIQALLAKSPFNNPKRMAAGLDNNRLMLLLAVLEKKTGMRFFDKDVYTNVVGGIKLDERACDLAVALCIASAFNEKALPADTAMIGEIALTGEIRSVSRIEKRVSECVRLGYSQIIVPADSRIGKIEGAKLVRIRNVFEAVALI